MGHSSVTRGCSQGEQEPYSSSSRGTAESKEHTYVSCSAYYYTKLYGL